MKPGPTPPLLRAVALLVAAGLAGVALWIAVLQPAWQWASYTPASATVTDCASRHFRAGTRYTPVARVADGPLVTGTVFTSLEGCQALVGQQVPVLLHPAEPSESRIASFTQFWLVPTVVLAACALSLALALWVRHWRARRTL